MQLRGWNESSDFSSVMKSFCTNTDLSHLFSGGHIGTALAMPATGYLCKYGFAGGWPSVFYVFGKFVLQCVSKNARFSF